MWGVGLACLADGGDAVAAQADVGLDDAPVVDDHRVGDHAIHGVFHAGPIGPLRLAHAIANGFAPAELDLFAVPLGAQGKVLFNFNDQGGVGQAKAVAHGGAVHLGVGTSADAAHDRLPCTSPRKPHTWRAPA